MKKKISGLLPYFLILSVFLIPLLFGGVSLGSIPALPKFFSQFRNPCILLAFTLSFLFILKVVNPFSVRIDKWIPTLFGIYLLAYLKASFLDYASFNLNAIDFSMYDFALANTWRGRFMETILGTNHFGIHATPVLFLILPFHALFHSPYFSLFLHPFLLWIAVFPLDQILKHYRISGWARFGILFSYLNCTLVSQTLHYGFHVESAYPVAGFLLYLSLLSKRKLATISALLFFLSIKEDAPFYAIGILLGAAWAGFLPRKMFFVTSMLSALVAVFYLKILIPENSNRPVYELVGAAAGFGATPIEAIIGVIQFPDKFFRNFFQGGWWAFILPSLGLFRFRPFFWITAAPFLFISTVAGGPLLLGLALYYGIPFVPILFMAWIQEFSSLPESRMNSYALTFACVGISLFGGAYLVFRKTDFNRWHDFSVIQNVLQNEKEKYEGRSLKICAPGTLIPHLGYPNELRLLEVKCLKTSDRIVHFDSNSEKKDPLSLYPLSVDEDRKIKEVTNTWAILVKSGEFTVRARPDSEKL